jgi:hypothetical protein
MRSLNFLKGVLLVFHQGDVTVSVYFRSWDLWVGLPTKNGNDTLVIRTGDVPWLRNIYERKEMKVILESEGDGLQKLVDIILRSLKFQAQTEEFLK